MHFDGFEIQIIRKAFKRSLGLTILVSGQIRVTAPKSTSKSRIEEFVVENKTWIRTNLQTYEILRRRFPRKEYRAGELFPYLGKQLKLVYQYAQALAVDVRGDELVVSLPSDRRLVRTAELSRQISEFYRSQGVKVLARRLQALSSQMGLTPSQVSFRSQKTRWGSCTAKGRISLNWRLIVAPLEVLDYVIVHELSHLRHYNHSVAFWNLVAAHATNYVELREWLNDHQYEADFLAERSELHF